MMLFDHVFPDVAGRDRSAIHTVDREGAKATFVLLEFYCTDPGCDCRRVVIQMNWVEGKRIVATISHAFERPRPSDGPQTFLEPFGPQSERSHMLLELFQDFVKRDADFRQRLQRHYKMWKEVVDDPSHRDHAKVRGVGHDDPLFRPAFPRNTGKKRSRRGSTAPRTTAGKDVGLVVANVGRANSKTQQRFRRLLDKVDRLREQLRGWKDQQAAIAGEVTAYHQLFAQEGQLRSKIVRLLDRHLLDGNRSGGQRAFSKAERKKLATAIVHLTGELIDSGGHDDLKEIYNRYSPSNYDAKAAADDAASAEAMKAMMEMFGADFGDADVSTMEKFQAYAESQLEEAEQEAAQEEAQAAERRAKRKKSAKQMASEARKAEEQQLATKALQNVYRALAWELHPDREQDALERERKAALMREVNVAYEAKDLLRLLELQIQLERLDVERAESLAEDQLLHYNRILDDQAKQLALELEEVELPYRMELDLDPGEQLSPQAILEQIANDRLP